MSNVKFWILWCPTSNLPPRVKMFTEKEAERAAEEMVKRTGREMIVMEAKMSFTQGKPVQAALKKKAKAGTKKEVTKKDALPAPWQTKHFSHLSIIDDTMGQD